MTTEVVDRSGWCEWPVWNGSYGPMDSRYRSCGRSGASAVDDPYSLGLSLCWQHRSSLFQETAARIRHHADPELLALVIDAVPTDENRFRTALISWINDQTSKKRNGAAADVMDAVIRMFDRHLYSATSYRLDPKWQEVADSLLQARLSEKWSA